MNIKNRVVLASQSPRRRQLLKMLFEEFEIHVSDVDESLPKGISFSKAVESLALRKAKAVQESEPGALVIGADTIVALAQDGLLLGKPKDEADAARMLRLLSGRAHDVYTGVALCQGERQEVFSCRTRVSFAPLSDEEIDWYISTGEPMDKAGSYGIQGYGARFISGIEGDYFNVMGLPVHGIYQRLGGLDK